jgi:hypothetical protein
VPPNNILEVLSRKPLLVGVAASALGALWDMSSWDASTSDLPVCAGTQGKLAHWQAMRQYSLLKVFSLFSLNPELYRFS